MLARPLWVWSRNPGASVAVKVKLRISPVAIVVSVFIHLALVAVVFFGWQHKKEFKPTPVPQYVEAKLVKLRSETRQIVKKKKPTKVDLTRKKKPVASAPAPAKPALTPPPKPTKTQAQIDAEKLKERKRQDAIEKERERLRIVQEMEDALKAEELAVAELELEQEAQSYMASITQRIEQNWSRPPSSRNNMRCLLLIQLVPTGRVVSVSVLESSGNPAFDRSAENAVKKVEIFPEVKEMPARVFETHYRRLRILFNPKDLRQ